MPPIRIFAGLSKLRHRFSSNALKPVLTYLELAGPVLALPIQITRDYVPFFDFRLAKTPEAGEQLGTICVPLLPVKTDDHNQVN